MLRESIDSIISRTYCPRDRAPREWYRYDSVGWGEETTEDVPRQSPRLDDKPMSRGLIKGCLALLSLLVLTVWGIGT